MKIPGLVVKLLGAVALLTCRVWYLVLRIPGFSLLDQILYGVKLPSNYAKLIKEAEDEEIKFTNEEFKGLEHNYLITRNGVRLHYVSGGNVDAPLMLFIHGFPESWYSWRKQLMEFKKDHFVVAFDMRGYNLSDKPRNRTDYDLPLLLNDIEDVIKHFKRSKCILVAHDWGGAISWTFTYKYPELIEKLIIMNAPHPLVMRNELKSAEQIRKSWYFFAFSLPFVPEMIITRPEMDRMYKDQLGNKDAMTETDVQREMKTLSRPGVATAAVNYYRNMFNGTRVLNSANTKTKIAAPTLVLWGENDIALGKQLTFGLERYIDQVTIKYFPKASHWVQQDEAVAVNIAVREWLQKK